ncbi:hypothetical protein AKJ16_DCAP15212 [Drosera capensis]
MLVGVSFTAQGTNQLHAEVAEQMNRQPEADGNTVAARNEAECEGELCEAVKRLICSRSK